MTLTASFASTSKGVRSSSRASGTSSMTRMDSKRERWQHEWNQNGTLKAVKSQNKDRSSENNRGYA